MKTLTLLPMAITVLALAACGDDEKSAPAERSRLPQGSEAVKLDPADFTPEIDNRYWPMKPGSRWVYRETDAEGADQKIVVTVLERTKRIANGIEARVVHDRVTDAKTGDLVEDTLDWYAQDKDGNVWYLGELTKEYEDGKYKSTAGSFEAGVGGAQPGIAMPAEPHRGLTYRQEYLKGEAEDHGEVVGVDEQAEVAAGHFEHAVMTKDLNPLEPKLVEFKLYAPGVGPVLELATSGGTDRAELISYRAG